MRRLTILCGVAAAAGVLLALAAASPRQPGYWIALGALIWAAAPYLGATSFAAMVARHAGLFGAIIVGVPFAISNPHHRAFWVLLVALVFIVAPQLFAMGWFYAEIRRLLRERTNTPDADHLGGHS